MADDNEGALKSIEDWEDMPKRLLEAIMEGLAKEPSKWAVMGLGFYLGYKGMDVLKYVSGNLNAIATAATGGGAPIFVDAMIDLNKLMIIPGEPIKQFLLLIGAAHEKEPPPEPESSETIAADPDKTPYQLWVHDQEVKLMAGAMGALAAVTITTPGFFAGIGAIVGAISPWPE